MAAKHPERVPPIAESAAEAVERRLELLEDSPVRAVLVAQIRSLAVALDESEPTDRAKLSKELAERMGQLNTEVGSGDGDDADWTEG